MGEGWQVPQAVAVLRAKYVFFPVAGIVEARWQDQRTCSEEAPETGMPVCGETKGEGMEPK